MSNKTQRLSQPKDSVITPGGPRPKDQVRSVKPGEAVRRNKDGTYTIIPIDKPPTKKKE
jgi:hypothetical protein